MKLSFALAGLFLMAQSTPALESCIFIDASKRISKIPAIMFGSCIEDVKFTTVNKDVLLKRDYPIPARSYVICGLKNKKHAKTESCIL